jgi:cell wall-associated NlpC family hydrolase
MKLMITLFVVFLSYFSFGQRDSIAESLVELAKTQLGVPYKWATSSPNVSFDCSGFTSYVYGSFDITKCRSSKGYGALGSIVPIEEAKKGDCILFSGTSPGDKTIGHVGIVVENSDEGLFFIHCSSSKRHFGVVVTDYYASGYPKRFLSIHRLF